MKKTNEDINAIIIVIVLVIILILYVVTLGKIDGDKFKIPKEYKDDMVSAKSRHKKLKALIEKQKKLKEKLDKKFKRIYFGVRVCLVCIWASIMFLLYYLGLIKELGDFLNYSELSVLLLITLNFLTFGTITELRNYLDLIKTRTENIVYGKYVSLKEKIVQNKENLIKLEQKINSNE